MNHKFTPVVNICRRLKEIGQALRHMIIVQFDDTKIVIVDCTYNRILFSADADEKGFTSVLQFITDVKRHLYNIFRFEEYMDRGLPVRCRRYEMTFDDYNNSRNWILLVFGKLPTIYPY